MGGGGGGGGGVSVCVERGGGLEMIPGSQVSKKKQQESPSIFTVQYTVWLLSQVSEKKRQQECVSVCTKCDTGSPSCASNQSVRGKETVGMSVFTVQYNVDSRNVSFYCAIQRRQ